MEFNLNFNSEKNVQVPNISLLMFTFPCSSVRFASVESKHSPKDSCLESGLGMNPPAASSELSGLP